MFDGRSTVFGVAPGDDLAQALVARLLDTMAGDPLRLAKTRVIVNTRRLERRFQSLFAQEAPCLLPRFDLVTELSSFGEAEKLLPAAPELKRQLELMQLLSQTVSKVPGLASEHAVVDLASSLSALFDEMQVEGVDPNALDALHPENQSDHWERNLILLRAFRDVSGAGDPGDMSASMRLRNATEAVVAGFDARATGTPIVLAGSTGSRGTTLALMCAIARLDQGAVVLPGFDFDLPGETWRELMDDAHGRLEDHPQYRFACFLDLIGLAPESVRRLGDGGSCNPARNALVSLGLRPAPVTNQWLSDGPKLGDLSDAVSGLTLLEAASPRDEADAISLIIREALEQGKVTALVTTDRVLTRQVEAALDQWRLVPDDSAGEPLSMTAIGRVLLQASELSETQTASDSFLALMKHPLVHSGEGRGEHLLRTREFELWIRKRAIPFIDPSILRSWSEAQAVEAEDWLDWLYSAFAYTQTDRRSVPDYTKDLRLLVNHLASGNSDEPTIWTDEAGVLVDRVLSELEEYGIGEHVVSAQDWHRILRFALQSQTVRRAAKPDPRVLFWGPLEARVQGADRVILAGLNEGSWPEKPGPDPWLNRAMRRELGLLLPERRIGLAAHDFQNAVGGKDVVLTRSLRSDGAITVPSRWLSRLEKLLSGLEETGGKQGLAEMRERGAHWLRLIEARRQTVAVPQAARPAPIPPVSARPSRLPVTAIQRLIRDPYAVYARYVLGLRRLDGLRPKPDPALRGQVVHKVFEQFSRSDIGVDADRQVEMFLSIGQAVLEGEVPWPAHRRLWFARLSKIAGSFIAHESRRDPPVASSVSEVQGRVVLPEIGFTLEARADRILQHADGRVTIVDYKTGRAPTPKEIVHFDRQLVLEALIAQSGGFAEVPKAEVASVEHIALSPEFLASSHLVDGAEDGFNLVATRAELISLVAAYQDPDQGFAARRAVASQRFEGDYDHLARFGEWDDGSLPTQERVG